MGFFIENPDEINVNFENTTSLFFRTSAPAPGDLPCDSKSQFHVTRYYEWVRGRVAGAANDLTSARCWLTTSADRGFAPGQSLLAALMIRSSPPDYPSAFRLASQAAAQGDILGELQLAAMYREGQGTAPDAAKAQLWAAQAQRSQDIAAWKRLNTNGDLGITAMDVIDVMGEAWEEVVAKSGSISAEAKALMQQQENNKKSLCNTGGGGC
jgi:TPR repeat protein